MLGTALRRYMKHLHDSAEREYHAALLSLFDRDPNATLVDLGCDDGSWTVAVAKAVGTTSPIGVDLIEERYANAEKRGVKVRPADLNGRMPFDDGFATVVHSNQVIEHVQDLDRFVSEIHRILQPGGYAVICSENLASWHNIASLVLGLQPFSLANISSTGSLGNPFALHSGQHNGLIEISTFFHTRVLAMRAFTEIFERHGFGVEKRGGTGYHPAPPAVARILAGLDVNHSHFIYGKFRKPLAPQ